MSRHRKTLLIPLAALLVVASTAVTNAAIADTGVLAVSFPVQSLDGSGNNVANPNWGRAGTNYLRVTGSRYADGRSQPVGGPNSRLISNRVFSDVHQNLFSERGVTQWGFTWGQFLDHTFGLRDEAGTAANIPFNSGDPVESFTNTLGVVPFVRSAAAPGTGVGNPREQVNTVSSYVEASAVYGDTAQRLEWLREGSLDGNVTNNGARLLLQENYLPRRDARGNPAAAPTTAVDGRLLANPNRAMVAGDVRVNENIALTATHTLFAREHNRIVDLLPASLSEEDKFQIARRVVAAEQQYITYTEFLPALGVNLAPYTGYRSTVNATLSNEFATVGYRAHSMIHGELEMEAELSRYSQATLDALEAQGVETVIDGDEIELAVPLNVAFFNPDIVSQLQLGPLLQGIGLEAEYRNDEQIDNQLRSVLFQVPVTGNPECLDGPELPTCFRGVVDLGAIDIERGRDHGMPSYNQLRAAYGLPAKASFAAITAEASENFPADPLLTPGNEINDPNSLDFTSTTGIFGDPLVPGSDEANADARVGVRRTPLAARLKAIYGSVNNVDAFVGMVAEPHVPGTDMGELQLAIWKKQFEALRDGDRFFFGNDQGLNFILNTYGIDYRRNLGDIIASNTDIPRAELAPNVFFVDGQVPPTSCRVTYRVTTQWGGGFQTDMSITNTGSTPINGWALRFRFANGQSITGLWNGDVVQNGANVPITNAGWNGILNPGQTLSGLGFNATWNNVTNARPASFTLNTTRCAIA